MAAAKGLFPLTNEELLQVLVSLKDDDNEEIRGAAKSSLDGLDPAPLAHIASDDKTNPEVLEFICLWTRSTTEMVESAIFNRSTPDQVLAKLASETTVPQYLEALALKQQALIRLPGIIDAILANPFRTPESERRAQEVRKEFFEKDYGARIVAEEQRIRAEAAPQPTIMVTGLEDLVALGLIEEGIDDSVVEEFVAEFGPFDEGQPTFEEQIDIEKIVDEVLGDIVSEEIPHEEITEDTRLHADRVPIFQQIALMSVKDRVMLGLKGTREARLILVRDPNRIVATSVMRNPRLTGAEIEYISSIRTVPEDILRQIGQNRAWCKSYAVMHNLVRNPRTPIAVSLGMLNRMQTRDLKHLGLNKNVPDVIRTTASRMYIKRNQGFE